MNQLALVYAAWDGLGQPEQIGTLRATQIRNSEHFE